MVSSSLAIDFQGGLSEAWTSVATFVPKFVAFLVILLVAWIVAKVVAGIVDKVLERVGFDRVVERGGIKQMLSNSQYDASDIIAKLAYYAILLIGLQMAFGVWGPNPVSQLLSDVVSWLPKAVIAIVIVVIAGAIARAVKDMITNALGGLSYSGLLGTIASVFIWALGVIAALNQIGIATAVTQPVLIAVLAAIAGIAIVGVGGGMVRPMQDRWERWLGNLENEVPAMRGQAEAYQRGREDAARGVPATQYQGAQQSAPQAQHSYAGQHAQQPPMGQQQPPMGQPQPPMGQPQYGQQPPQDYR